MPIVVSPCPNCVARSRTVAFTRFFRWRTLSEQTEPKLATLYYNTHHFIDPNNSFPANQLLKPIKEESIIFPQDPNLERRDTIQHRQESIDNQTMFPPSPTKKQVKLHRSRELYRSLQELVHTRNSSNST